MSMFSTRFATPPFLAGLLCIMPLSDAFAGRCADDIKQIDEAIKNQCGGNGTW